jgi:EmrB/QacA subfamily drug resistance transporter
VQFIIAHTRGQLEYGFIMAKEGERKWGILLIVCLAVFIMVIDTTIMNVSITALVEELNTEVHIIQAVIAIYALIMASFMLFGGKMQDVMGRKNAFLFGVILYGIGTFTASISWNVTVLLIGWSLLEGLGAVFMMPATTTFITDAYKGQERAFAFAIWGGIGAAGAAFGPIIGGFLTTYYSWRWAFRIELVVVVIILAMSFLIEKHEPSAHWRDIDVIGTILSFGGMSLIVLAILQLRNLDVWEFIPIAIGAGLLLLGVFFIWEKRRSAMGSMPLTDIALFKNRVFSLGNAGSIVQTAVFAGFLFIIPIFLQSVTGIDAFTTGLMLLPMSITVFIVSIVGARLSRVINPKYLVLIGLATAILGSVILRGVFSLTTLGPDIIPGSVIFGLGMGIVLSQVTNITLSSVEDTKQTDASGILNTLKQLGTSLGTALIGVVLLLTIFTGIIDGIDESGIAGDMDRDEIAEELNYWIEKMKTEGTENIPEELIPVLTDITDTAISDGMAASFDAISLILIFGFLAIVFVPAARLKEPGNE